MTKSLKTIVGTLAALGFIGLKLAAHFGIGTGFVAAEVEASRHQRWPAEFKSEFVKECANQGTPDQKAYLDTFCECIANKIENAHVVTTKYNSITSSEEEYGKQLGDDLTKFLDSPAGIAASEECNKNSMELVK